jgi:hypothetical protein
MNHLSGHKSSMIFYMVACDAITHLTKERGVFKSAVYDIIYIVLFFIGILK